MKRVLVALFIFVFSASIVFAEQKEGFLQKMRKKISNLTNKTDTTPTKKPATPAANRPMAKVEKKVEMTKEQLLVRIKSDLKDEKDILNSIPELKSTGEKENATYTYSGTRLEDLDKDKLQTVFNRIQGEALRIRTDHINKQLETIRQANQANIAAQQANRAQNIGATPVPQPPKQPMPPQARIPQPPSSPTQQTQVPKAPPTPPAPPRR